MSTQTKAVPRPQSERVSHMRWLYGPLGGALLGAGFAFGYAFVFIVYATIRVALLPARVSPDAGLSGTVVAYGESLAIATLAITVLMAIPAAIMGAISAFIITWLLSLLNPQHAPRRAVIIGMVACFTLIVSVQLFFQRALGFTLADVIANPETYLLWLGFPSLLLIAAGGVASWQWNRVRIPCA